VKDNDWAPLSSAVQPPPRMVTRMVTDTRNQMLIVFGGDGQRFYLADTWIFDLKTRTWRESKAPGGPEPRAGHFTVYDPESGMVIIGGGHNRKDLTDMWAFDPAPSVTLIAVTKPRKASARSMNSAGSVETGGESSAVTTKLPSRRCLCRSLTALPDDCSFVAKSTLLDIPFQRRV